MSGMDHLRSGATGMSLARLRREAEERRFPDDGYGGLFRSQDARDAWKAVMADRLKREGDAAKEGRHG